MQRTTHAAAAPEPQEWTTMLDVIFLITGAALFALTAAYVAACDRM